MIIPLNMFFPEFPGLVERQEREWGLLPPLGPRPLGPAAGGSSGCEHGTGFSVFINRKNSLFAVGNCGSCWDPLLSDLFISKDLL